MLLSLNGKVQPPVCSKPHWAEFSAFAQHPDLYDILRTNIVREVSAIVAARPNAATIESPRLGARVLGSIGSWWHAEFARRFPYFPNGAARGVFGMMLWNYLAGTPSEWWSFVEQEDSHGYGQNAMRYWQINAGFDPK